jgi:hypothetical protein
MGINPGPSSEQICPTVAVVSACACGATTKANAAAAPITRAIMRRSSYRDYIARSGLRVEQFDRSCGLILAHTKRRRM